MTAQTSLLEDPIDHSNDDGIDGDGLGPKRTKAPHIYDIIARRKLGVDDGWDVCTWDATNDQLMKLELRESAVTRSGQRLWGKEKRVTTLTPLEIENGRLKWEEEHGACYQCGGGGRASAGWSAAKGYRYRPCTRCNATGMPPAVLP